ncbi:MAG: redox-regulated ATPase YchF [Chloroflexota bacterium]
MEIGIIGLPQVGKTTLFSLLTNASGSTAGRDTHVGMARVPDRRIDFLSGMYRPRKTIYAQIKFTDIPGFSGGPTKGVNPFLQAVRDVDALVHVVRVFESDVLPHPEGSVDPRRDIENIGLELVFHDLGLIENKLARLEKEKRRTKEAELELAAITRAKGLLEEGRLMSAVEFSDDEANAIRGYAFLSNKPMILAVNVSEDQLLAKDYPGKDAVAAYAAEHNLPVVEFCGRIEEELAELPPEDRATFMAEYGIPEPGIDRLARAAYHKLGLISFFTVGPDEVRAWTIREGTDAKRAAGKIHSDIEKGFIRAEVFKFADLERLGSEAAVKEHGLWRLEGKEYPVADGDIINFRFNV